MEEHYDGKDVILSIYAGTGGKDAQDWATILLRMYQRYLLKKGFQIKEISRIEGEGGIKSVTLEVEKLQRKDISKGVYGILKGESGVHRLVRISPFSAKALRHTSFAKVEVLPKIEESKIDVKKEDLKIETFKASGPGGQYVNKRESAVRIIHLPTGISVVSQSERSQGDNREKALMVLGAKLHQLFEEKREKEIQGRRETKQAKWGNQIRSYVFQPYQIVKDHRTNVKTSNLKKVLDGDLDKFIEKENR
ncbi:MAG: peptide chain release factor 2 [Parcubacteria group bacterium CG_4_9_14_0_2_um_filter_35_11]|nr:MAG: peptide chain release factor 2 [Parcubacteria group bacterium CG_4_9_14_0_2_um_filter_35_11]